MDDAPDTPAETLFVWHGVLDPCQICDDAVAAGHRLADAAKAGDWSTVLRLLDDPRRRVDINSWRPGGTAWFTPLHQAAWHHASADVVNQAPPEGRAQVADRFRRAHRVRRLASPDSQARRVEKHRSTAEIPRSVGSVCEAAAIAADSRAYPRARRSPGRRHRRANPWSALRRAGSTYGIALPAGGDFA